MHLSIVHLDAFIHLKASLHLEESVLLIFNLNQKKLELNQTLVETEPVLLNYPRSWHVYLCQE